MTDKEYETQKKRVQKLADKWIKPLGLGWWRIEIIYERTNTDKDPDDHNLETVMCVSPLPQYRRATITCYLLSIKDIEDDDLEKDFIHELMHIFVSPMSTKGKHEQEEYVATDLANAFWWFERHLVKKLGDKSKGNKPDAGKHSESSGGSRKEKTDDSVAVVV